jgi:hypothetical protein
MDLFVVPSLSFRLLYGLLIPCLSECLPFSRFKVAPTGRGAALAVSLICIIALWIWAGAQLHRTFLDKADIGFIWSSIRVFIVCPYAKPDGGSRLRQYFASPGDTVTKLYIGEHFDAAESTVIIARLRGDAKCLPVIGVAEDFESHIESGRLSPVFYSYYSRRISRVCSDAAKTNPWALISPHFIEGSTQNKPLSNTNSSGNSGRGKNEPCRFRSAADKFDARVLAAVGLMTAGWLGWRHIGQRGSPIFALAGYALGAYSTFVIITGGFGQPQYSESFICRSENVRVSPIVISELELGNIERHIFAAHFVERADHSALEDRQSHCSPCAA